MKSPLEKWQNMSRTRRKRRTNPIPQSPRRNSNISMDSITENVIRAEHDSFNISNPLINTISILMKTPSPKISPNKNENHEPTLMNIETPKRSLHHRISHLENTQSDQDITNLYFKSNARHNWKNAILKTPIVKPKKPTKNVFKRSKSENELIKLKGVNLNPYMNYGDIKPLGKHFEDEQVDNTINESYFSPELFKTKPASTPIQCNENLQTPLNGLNNIRKIGKTCKPVPKFERKVSKILSKTLPGKTSANNVQQYKCTLYKSLIEEETSTGTLHDETLNILRKILKRLYKYGAATAKWTMSLFSICSKLGNSLRQGLSTLFCMFCEKKSEGLDKCDCCAKYRDEIEQLHAKMNELSTNLLDLKVQLLENVQNNRKIDELNSNLEEISKEVSSLKLLKPEIDNLRVQLQKPGNVCKNIPAPPPLPPPLPIPSFNTTLIAPIKKNNSKLKGVKSSETPRPTISLDDILKVKLRKTSERQISKRKSSLNQPEISLEMLHQVKLRKPSSRSLTPTNLTDIISCSEGSTSPHSSLKKILKDDASFKIKRLKRVKGYSFDDHRKNMSKLSRDRE